MHKTKPTREAPALIDKRYVASWLDTLFDFSAAKVEKASDQINVRIKYALFPEDHRDIANAMMQTFQDAENTTGKRVVVSIDSPGGTVQGCFEACYDVEQARAQHPDITVTVFTDGMIASAAFAHACAMTTGERDEIVSTPTAEAGSIGVVMSHWDETKALDEMGVKIEYFAFPPGKADGRLGASLSDDAKTKLQSDIETLYAKFAGLVSRSRGLTVDQITALNADVFLGADAVAKGLVDRVVESPSVLFIDGDSDTAEPPPVDSPDTPTTKNNEAQTNRVITAEVTMADTDNKILLASDAGTVTVSNVQPSREAELLARIAQLEVAAVMATRPDLSEEQKTFLAGKSKAEVEGFLAILPAKADEPKAKNPPVVALPAAGPKAATGVYPVEADKSKLDRAQVASLNKFKKVSLSDAAKARVSYNEHEGKIVIR